MTSQADQLRRRLLDQADPDRAIALQRFFKTGKGGYAEGDRFLGLTVPTTRSTAAAYPHLGLDELLALLQDDWHEVRLASLILMTGLFNRSSTEQQLDILDAYLAHTRHINNWDLVDVSAHKIAGPWFLNRNRDRLDGLIDSPWLWDRRIAVVATACFIRNGDLSSTFQYSERLLRDPHDLMHKACGWMLREAGKRDPDALRAFLGRHASVMPRTMLRYSIEKMEPAERRKWMA
jgi:3-methyladenine DNA glycosylase AlkD